ncbi:MAG TPA: NAD(P) transhydrogenase subunit alpha [Spirochaetes bacterium]|nr:NAD(P) transhydrogenase subunit alpha [Spirochaetota bacterium]
MITAALTENHPGETRVPLLPPSVEKLAAAGITVHVGSGIGDTLGIGDTAYEKAGATVVSDRTRLLADADLVLRLRKPSLEEVPLFRAGSVHAGYLDPFNERALVEALAEKGVTAVSMEMMPRTTLAQKMDVLSSQANLGGYAAVVLAAARLDKIFPMLTTAAGTIQPARVFVIGAGVAGLQAIATAHRLGARVEAFDTRPVVEEQVKSLGARFVKIDIGETGQTKDGYAKALTEEQLEKQRRGMAKVIAASDVVITTAQIFGKKAPRIVTADMVAGMRPGSVVVDMAVESGGNVEGSRLDEEVRTENGVLIMGHGNLPGKVPVHAGQVYSANLANFVLHFYDREADLFRLDLSDEILKGCVVTHGGQIINPLVRQVYGLEEKP